MKVRVFIGLKTLKRVVLSFCQYVVCFDGCNWLSDSVCVGTGQCDLCRSVGTLEPINRNRGRAQRMPTRRDPIQGGASEKLCA